MSEGTLNMWEILRSGGFTVADLLDAFRELDNAAVVEWCEEHGDVKWKDSATCHIYNTQNFPNNCIIGPAYVISHRLHDDEK